MAKVALPGIYQKNGVKPRFFGALPLRGMLDIVSKNILFLDKSAPGIYIKNHLKGGFLYH